MSWLFAQMSSREAGHGGAGTEPPMLTVVELAAVVVRSELVDAISYQCHVQVRYV